MAGSIVAIDWTLGVQAVNFLVFMFLINKFLFKPLLELMEERERELGGIYSEVEALKEKASSLLREVDEIISKAKEEAKGKIDLAVKEAREEREKLIAKAQEEAAKRVERAKEEIWKSFEEEKEKLEREAEKLAQEIVKKILGKAA
jgi:F-type H+-transporting ATPase subunit b